MADVVSIEKRSAMMAGIRSKNTKPEIFVRKWLHAQGYRFRLHKKELPGKPDIVLPKYKVVIFVHGCFWHNHQCKYSHIPSTRTDWWMAKFKRNEDRHLLVKKQLEDAGWKIFVIWECEVRNGEYIQKLEKICHELNVSETNKK